MWSKNRVKAKRRRTGFIIIGILMVWTALTLWVQFAGKENILFEGDSNASKKALIVYNPDPIYNLDEQVCLSFAQGLSPYDYWVKIATIDNAIEDTDPYDLFVFCANTYNWAPDWKIKRFVRDYPRLQSRNVVAITLGSGSTSRSKRLFEETILSRQAHLIDSRTYWLLRPNDEARMEESNVEVAKDMARKLGKEIGNKF